MAIFTVTGRADTYAEAERGTVHVSIGVSSLVKQDAYNKAVELHNRIVTAADAFKTSGSATWYTASAPRTHAYQEAWKTDGEDADVKHRTRYSTASTVKVKFRDFSKLGEWLAELAEDENSFISYSVNWDITEETRLKLQREVRVRAVRIARELANDYARGAELAIDDYPLQLQSITDEDSRGVGVAPAMRGAASGRREVATIAPEEIRVSAGVTAVFEYVHSQ